MTPRLWMVAGVLVLVVGLTGAVYTQQLRVEAAESETETRTAERDQALDKLATTQDQLEAVEQLQIKHQQERDQLRAETLALEAAVGNRQQTIRKLQRENDHLRAWADIDLPEPIIRMRERPALTGAAAYRQFLLDAGALPASSEQSAQKRRPEPGH